MANTNISVYMQRLTPVTRAYPVASFASHYCFYVLYEQLTLMFSFRSHPTAQAVASLDAVPSGHSKHWGQHASCPLKK